MKVCLISPKGGGLSSRPVLSQKNSYLCTRHEAVMIPASRIERSSDLRIAERPDPAERNSSPVSSG
jgi:hypothetical protein